MGLQRVGYNWVTDNMVESKILFFFWMLSLLDQGCPRFNFHGPIKKLRGMDVVTQVFYQNVVHWGREWQTPSVFLFCEPHDSMKSQKHRTLKDELPWWIGAQYATGDQWRNNSRKNEEIEPKQKQHPVVDVTGDRSKVRCCKEQYCIGTWNVRSMNQGKLEVVKQEMARVNVDTLGIRELKWTGMGEFNSGDHNIYYCGQESLGRNGVAIIVNKTVWNACT